MNFSQYCKLVEAQRLIDLLIYALNENKITSWQEPENDIENPIFYYDEDSDNEIINNFIRAEFQEEIIDYLSEFFTNLFDESIKCKLVKENDDNYIILESTETKNNIILQNYEMMPDQQFLYN